jgi:hypothetical protein
LLQDIKVELNGTIGNSMTSVKDETTGFLCPVYTVGKVIHPKYYKHFKKGAHQSHLGRQKMG